MIALPLPPTLLNGPGHGNYYCRLVIKSYKVSGVEDALRPRIPSGEKKIKSLMGNSVAAPQRRTENMY